MASPLGHKKALQAVEVEAYRQIMSGAALATLAAFLRGKCWTGFAALTPTLHRSRQPRSKGKSARPGIVATN